MDQNQVAPGSEEYNQQMADKFANQEANITTDQQEEIPVAPMPEGGQEKFYNKETGQYDWQNHAKELEYRMQQGKVTPEERENIEKASNADVRDVVTRAGLDPMSLQHQLRDTGTLSEDAIAALEKQGIKRELIDLYVENWNFRADSMRTAALDYAGGEQEWNGLSSWAAQNLTEAEVNRYNQLLSSDEWKVALDALKVRRDSSNPEPRLVGGNESFNGSSFGYTSKAEMKADMSNPLYATSPAFRKQVMQKIQSANWSMDSM